MVDSSLGTTNLLLGIMAAVSVLQALVLAGVAVGAWKVYGRSIDALADARRQIEPVVARVSELAERVEGIADDLSNVTSRVASATARAETALGTAAGIASGLRAAYQAFVRPNGGAAYSEE